jgi:hypothetical protein
MTTSRVTTTAAILSAAALLWPVAARAVQQTFEATDQATIEDASGESRILVLFDGLTDLDGEWIQSATLHIPLSGEIPADVDVMVDVPRTSWTSAASWNSPWTKAGGDPYDEQAVVRPAKAGRSGTLSLDVTHLVRSMAAGETPENGFLIWPADGARLGFSSGELSAFGSRSQAILEVTYRKLSAHFKAGAQELADRKRTTWEQ